MRYINLTIEILTSAEFLGCEPLDRATWLCLMRYCAQHETGGIIRGSADWGIRKWMQLCGVTKDEVARDCDLWQWKGTNLHVKFYPAEQEAVIQAKREAGKHYGRGKTKTAPPTPPTPTPTPPPDSTANSSPISSPINKQEADNNRKDKGKGKEETPLTPHGGDDLFAVLDPIHLTDQDRATGDMFIKCWATVHFTELSPTDKIEAPLYIAKAHRDGIPYPTMDELLKWYPDAAGLPGVPRLKKPSLLANMTGGPGEWFRSAADARTRKLHEPPRPPKQLADAKKSYA